MTPVLLDTFCGAGGCTKGYQRAGFRVVGVDIVAQPHYCGDDFVQADALEFIAQHGREFDVIHASPPCQGYSVTAAMPNVKDENYPKLVPQVRALLQATGRPYVIENVPGAPLLNPIVLCGLMFGLKVFRHRLFETQPFILGPQHIKHPKDSVTNSFRAYSAFERGATHISLAGHNFKRADGALAMGGVDWMTRGELAQAIPPAYTEWLGRQLWAALEEE